MNDLDFGGIGGLVTDSGTVADAIDLAVATIAKDLKTNPSDKARKISIDLLIEPTRDGFGKLVGANVTPKICVSCPKPIDPIGGDPTVFILHDGTFARRAEQEQLPI